MDISIGVAAIAVAAIAIYLFVRASRGTSKAEPKEPATITEGKETATPSLPISQVKESGFKIPEAQRHLEPSAVDRAKSSIRTLTIQRELISMVLKRLFEAEDEGEITREERVRLSKGYEEEMKQIAEDLKQSELIVTLNELETIRDDILKKFEETLSNTQSRIDTVLKELKIEGKREEAPEEPQKRRRRPVKREEKPSEEAAEEEEEEEAAPSKPKSDVEAKLEQLRMEVLKELEELEKLELGT
jgi:uncharacterized protein YceH (UPF0502 family)